MTHPHDRPARLEPGPALPLHDAIDDDDRPVGRVLTRREILALFGAGGVSLTVAACAPGSNTSAAPTGSGGLETAGPTASNSVGPVESGVGAIPSCVVVPELTEGPYYIDTGLERSDIRPDTTTGETAPGVSLTLGWVVSLVDGSACTPLEGAVVDVWHCDAGGVYSGVQGVGGDFLRGVQRTDADGRASFTTVYPGWYRGRAVHIHFKIRTDPAEASGYELTSQLFFDDMLSARVFASAPYQGAPDTPNSADGIFGQSDGTTLLAVTPSGDGYATTFSIALQPA